MGNGRLFLHEKDSFHRSWAYTGGMVRRIENDRRAVNLEAATQQLLDLNPEVWSKLMQFRGETKQNVLLLVRGHHVDPVGMEDQSVSPQALTLEPAQAIVEVSGLDDAPSIRIVKISGDFHWQMIEDAIMDTPPRVVPVDERIVRVMDDPADPYTMSQEDPRVLEYEGIDG